MSFSFHEIESVVPGSIADEMGIESGDKLLTIGGEAVRDVLDYRFRVQDEFLLVEVEKAADGELWELEIEKDPDEDLGLLFVPPLMSASKICCNQCVFCFVEQQPSGLRPSLYVKDDDPRLSFLMGNYATLTNLSDEEITRLAGYHLSPLRVSVHAADLDLRCKMMGTERARNLFDALDMFNQAGISMHFQVVLCKGLNDGKQLDYTIEKLAELQPGAASLAIVPAGLTKHRSELYQLEPFTSDDAVAVISQVGKWQDIFRDSSGTSFVFLADEWYIMAGKNPPEYDTYEDFPQLDNGVGMLRLFEQAFFDMLGNCFAISQRSVGKTSVPCTLFCEYIQARRAKPTSIGIVTGKAAALFMEGLARHFESEHAGVKMTVYVIENQFFGANVTVSGLIVGQDVISQLKNRVEDTDVIFLPQNAFRVDTEDMLDGCTREDVEKSLSVPVVIGSSDGGEFYKQLFNLLHFATS